MTCLYTLFALYAPCLAGAGGIPLALVYPNAEDIDLKIEILNDVTYPHQALRARITLKNVSERRLGPLYPAINGLTLKGPLESKFHVVPAPLYGKDRPTLPSNAGFMWDKVPLFLEPNEYISVSRPVAVWRRDGGTAFPKPGTHFLKCTYRVADKEAKYLEKVIQFKISEPKGEDGEFYRLLQKHAGVAWAMSHPIQPPDKEDLPLIKELIRKYPQSSYAPYAHFALARAWISGVEKPSASRRICQAMIADELDKIIKHRLDPVRKVVVAESFPYRPRALILQSYADIAGRRTTLRYLHTQHEDALEWIGEFATMVLGHGHGLGAAEDLTGRRIISDLGREEPGAREEIWRIFRVKR